MTINKLLKKFKLLTKINYDLTVWPITLHSPFTIDTNKKKANGLVFTPLQIVDKMIALSLPKPNQYNMDLCAGNGQFTIRMLRYFTNTYANFDVAKYLQLKHWFNEYDMQNAQNIIDIFGNNINLCIGDARLLSKMPLEDESGNWLKGIWIYYLGLWRKI